ncbi:hypothetical protein Q3G72_033936 [Acer saccharum]|nr:hypothetical protein Q3G72_033936 [Acer saccharum]
MPCLSARQSAAAAPPLPRSSSAKNPPPSPTPLQSGRKTRLSFASVPSRQSLLTPVPSHVNRRCSSTLIAVPSQHQFRRSDCTSSVGVQSPVRPDRVRHTDCTSSSPPSLQFFVC